MPARWNPHLYLTFGDERTRPAADLLARVHLQTPKAVFDLGCGPGNSTGLLASRFPAADIVGVDASAEMLTEARASGVRASWVQADFDRWSPEEPADLIYSNAAFQWSADPLALTVRLYRALAPHGVLALQVPQNFDQPSHLEVRAVVEDGRWAETMRKARQYDPGFVRATDYARALASLRAALDIWSTEYLHRLDGPDAVFRWMSGTGLRPFTQRLDGAERLAFEAAVRERLARAYPAEPDGRTFCPFRRLFVIATKG
jgi:trans-aconitate 2-methyltransferase